MKKTQLWFVALILLLTACRSAPPAEPVNIGVTLDNSRAVSQVIPNYGRQLDRHFCLRSLRGFDANMTLGRTKNVDILVSDPANPFWFK